MIKDIAKTAVFVLLFAALLWLSGKEAIKKKTLEPITEAQLQERLDQAKGYAVVLETLKYYREAASDNGYSQDAAHLLEVWILCEGYAALVSDGAFIETINRSASYKKKARAKICATDMALFMFCISADETNHNPEAIATNKNGTRDTGITQINQECHNAISRDLTPELWARPWTDTEKNIAGRYIWIIQRINAGKPWDKMTKKRGWKLYERLKKATEKHAGEGACS